VTIADSPPPPPGEEAQIRRRPAETIRNRILYLRSTALSREEEAGLKTMATS
jgi:hypothetical protein